MSKLKKEIDSGTYTAYGKPLGAPVKFGKSETLTVLNHARKHFDRPLRWLAAYITDKGTPISYGSVRRILQKHRVEHILQRKKCPLNKKNRNIRFEFAKKELKRLRVEGIRMIFTDEMYLRYNSGSRSYIWCRYSEADKMQFTETKYQNGKF